MLRRLIDSARQLAAAPAAAVRPAARALLDLHPERSHRWVWAAHGHAQIEVRGMNGSGPQHRRVAASVTERLRGLRGVRWAEVNAVTGQVLVAFEERRVNVGTLLDTVRDVEAAHGTRGENFSWSRPVHPADPTPIQVLAIERTGIVNRRSAWSMIPPTTSARPGAATYHCTLTAPSSRAIQ